MNELKEVTRHEKMETGRKREILFFFLLFLSLLIERKKKGNRDKKTGFKFTSSREHKIN
jgi:hypothetical protein